MISCSDTGLSWYWDFVVGSKIGTGNLHACVGSKDVGRLRLVSFCLYLSNRPPYKNPRTTHSIGIISIFFTSNLSLSWVFIMWLLVPRALNQNSANLQRISPFPGIGVSISISNADIRSVKWNKRLPFCNSYMSLTFPFRISLTKELIRFTPIIRLRVYHNI